MFGNRKAAARNELDLSDVSGLEKSRESLRMWAQENGPVICIIDPEAIGPDPAAFGIALVDALRHGALAYAGATGISEEDALARIWEGFDAELDQPTDAPTPLDNPGRPN